MSKFQESMAYVIGKTQFGGSFWAIRWPAIGGAAGLWSVRWAVPGRTKTAEVLCVVDDFGDLVAVNN